MDSEFVRLAQRGDRAAFERVAFELSDDLFAIAVGILRDREAAADVLQLTLVNIWRDLPSLREPERLRAWSRRILVNRCYQTLRYSRRWPVFVPIDPVESLSQSASPDVETRDELERAFVRLTPEQRAVVVLYYLHDRTMDDVAANLDLSIGTVKSRLHHARRALRAAIEADARPARQEGPAT